MKNIIYKIIDPRTKEVRYIGKSEQGVARFHEHLKPSSLDKDTHKDRWIKQLFELNLIPLFEVLETFESPEQLFEAEIKWFNHYKSLGANLTNSTECGKGTRGYKHKDSTKQIISEKASIRQKGQPLPEGMKTPKTTIIINGLSYRHCIKCKKDVLLTEFSLKIKQKTYQGYCKPCSVEWHREWREKNPSKTLSEEDYNKSRQAGARAGGQAIANSPKARANLSKKLSKAIQGVNILTGEIITFPSALKAKEAGFQNTNIGQAIKLKRPYKGYTWSFL